MNYVMLMLIFIECMPGKYGLNCASTCGQCGDVLDCSNIDGLCQTGCSPGFHGQLCKESKIPPVKKNKYTILKHNFNKTILMLEVYYIQTPSYLFIKECAIGTYGLNCTMVCGQCTEISDCSNVNGICGSGCNPGYIGANCKEGLEFFACIYCNIRH